VAVRTDQTLDGPHLALALAGGDEQKKAFMLQQLANAQAQKIKRRDLPQWLEAAAAGYPGR
jgi:hypothetical protein